MDKEVLQNTSSLNLWKHRTVIYAFMRNHRVINKCGRSAMSVQIPDQKDFGIYQVFDIYCNTFC